MSVSYLKLLSYLVSTLFFLSSILPGDCKAQDQLKIDSLGPLWSGNTFVEPVEILTAKMITDSQFVVWLSGAEHPEVHLVDV